MPLFSVTLQITQPYPEAPEILLFQSAGYPALTLINNLDHGYACRIVLEVQLYSLEKKGLPFLPEPPVYRQRFTKRALWDPFLKKYTLEQNSSLAFVKNPFDLIERFVQFSPPLPSEFSGKTWRLKAKVFLLPQELSPPLSLFASLFQRDTYQLESAYISREITLP